MLDYRNASCVFSNGRGLTDVNFSVPDASIVGFIGRNGAGKTTAMRLAMRLLKPTNGQITWDNAPLSGDVVNQFGYMPEERGLYPRMRVAEQLEYLGELRGLKSKEARREREYWSEALGFEDKTKERLQALSLGNQQRVQLASAFLGSPKVLILDEPFSGLDPVSVETLSSHIREFRDKGAAILVSSHQLNLLEDLCDQAVIISEGKIVADGKMMELLDDDNGAFIIQFEYSNGPWKQRPANVEATDDELVYQLTPTSELPLPAVVSQASEHAPIRAIKKVRRTLADVLRAAQHKSIPTTQENS